MVTMVTMVTISAAATNDSVIIRIVLNYDLYSTKPVSRSFSLRGATVTVTARPIDETVTIATSGSYTGDDLLFTRIEVYFWPECPDTVKWGECKNLEGDRQVLQISVVRSMFESFDWPGNSS